MATYVPRTESHSSQSWPEKSHHLYSPVTLSSSSGDPMRDSLFILSMVGEALRRGQWEELIWVFVVSLGKQIKIFYKVVK